MNQIRNPKRLNRFSFAPLREKCRILFLFRASSARLISNGDAIAKEAS
jgi:hypothetical protein